MITSKQIFEYLPGIWKLSRKTSSQLKHRQGTSSRGECIKADGYAAFLPTESDPNVILYSEKVIVYNFDLNNEKNHSGIEAKQKYTYKYDQTAQTVTKYFYDGRLFYTLNIIATDSTEPTLTGSSSFQICGEHLCIQDNYASSYVFGKADNGELTLTLTYSVNGPKKCYDIITEYEKLNADNLNDLDIQIVNGEMV